MRPSHPSLPLHAPTLTIILDRPQLAVNIGMVARAMANFGLYHLRIVKAGPGWPAEGGLKKGASASACGAIHLIEQAQIFSTLEEAVGDLNFLWATTARPRGLHKPVFLPHEALAVSLSRQMSLSTEKTLLPEGEFEKEVRKKSQKTYQEGILFGPERAGLDNEGIALADALIHFPVEALFPSVNLAQAVLLIAYEFKRAQITRESVPFSVASVPSLTSSLPFSPPPRKLLLSFFSFLEEELERSGFFRPPEKKKIMRQNLRNIFHRLQLTEQDIRTLWGAAARVIRGRRNAS